MVAEGDIYTDEEFELHLRNGTIPKDGFAELDITNSKVEFEVVSARKPKRDSPRRWRRSDGRVGWE